MNKTLDQLLTDKRKAVILFFSEDTSLLDGVFSILDRAYHNHRDVATIAFFDVRGSQSNILSIPITQSPELAFFIDQKYAGSYYGNWTDSSILDFISDFIQESRRPTELSSISQIHEFQETKPVNLILFGEYHSNLAADFLTFFEQYSTIPVARVSNSALAYLVGIEKTPMIQLNRPLDEIQVNFEQFSVHRLQQSIHSIIKPIHKNQLFGNSIKTPWTLIALVDNNNSVHRHIYAEVAKHCRTIFGSFINYESCDFFVCNRLTSYSRVNNITNPVFFAMKQYEYKNSTKPIQYKSNVISPVAIRKWLRDIITTKPHQLDLYAEEINARPILTVDKHEFLEIINDNSTDSLFLFNIRPKTFQNRQQEDLFRLHDYDFFLKAKEMYKLRCLLQDTESITFYFFVDELTEKELQSLNLTTSMSLNYALYRAGSKPNYKILEADTTPICLSSIVDNVKSQLSQKTKEKVQEFLSNKVLN